MEEKEEKASQFIMFNGVFLEKGFRQWVLTYGVEVINKGSCKTARFYVWNERNHGSSHFETEKEALATYTKLKNQFVNDGATIISEGL